MKSVTTKTHHHHPKTNKQKILFLSYTDLALILSSTPLLGKGSQCCLIF